MYKKRKKCYHRIDVMSENINLNIYNSIWEELFDEKAIRNVDFTGSINFWI